MNGPIVKDGAYFAFWSGALLIYITMQAGVIAMLWAILREVRR
jgi:hypothetical protein